MIDYDSDPTDTLGNELNQWDKPKSPPPAKAQPLAPADDRAQMYNDVQWDPTLQGYEDVQYPDENTPKDGYKNAGQGNGVPRGQSGGPGVPGQSPIDGHPGDPYGEHTGDQYDDEEV